MATNVYAGVNNVARKVSGIYVGVNNVARKVTKAYVGVNGVARLCYSAETSSALENVLKKINIVSVAGRNASAQGSVGISAATVAAGTYYAVSLCNGYFGIHKVTNTGSGWTRDATLFKAHSSYGGVYANTGGFSDELVYSSSGSSSTSVYAATIAIFTVAEIAETDVDTTLSALSMIVRNGRNTSTTGPISVNVSGATGFSFAAFGADFGVAKIVNGSATLITGTHATNPSLLYINGSTAYISTTGTSIQSARGSLCVFGEAA